MGSIRIDAPKGLPVVYTLDGSVPTAKSAIYHGPVSLPRGGELQAAYLKPTGELGMLATKYFSGLSPIGWKVVSVENEDARHPASNAIDGNSATFWESSTADNSSSHQITLDMGSIHQIAGFSYLPRQDGVREAIVQGYRFETSTDGVNWKTDVDAGRFANVCNNPVVQETPFEAVAARYFRFIALQSSDTRASAAEISVLPAEQH